MGNYVGQTKGETNIFMASEARRITSGFGGPDELLEQLIDLIERVD
jgi:hypothetical protein